MTSELLRATLDYMDKTNAEDWRRIERETGLQFAWLRQLALGNIKDPSVNKIETLHKHFAGVNFPIAD